MEKVNFENACRLYLDFNFRNFEVLVFNLIVKPEELIISDEDGENIWFIPRNKKGIEEFTDEWELKLGASYSDLWIEDSEGNEFNLERILFYEEN